MEKQNKELSDKEVLERALYINNEEFPKDFKPEWVETMGCDPISNDILIYRTHLKTNKTQIIRVPHEDVREQFEKGMAILFKEKEAKRSFFYKLKQYFMTFLSLIYGCIC